MCRSSFCAGLTHACMISIKGRRNDNVTSKVAHPRAVWNYFCTRDTPAELHTLLDGESKRENTSIPNCSPTLLLTSERYVGKGEWEKLISPQLQTTPRQIIGWTFYLPSDTHFSPSLVFAAISKLVSLASIEPQSSSEFCEESLFSSYGASKREFQPH
jgi:hypothetical protein